MTSTVCRQIVETVRAAGIFVVASAGNNGYSGCESVVDPIAIYDDTFSVGAHNASGAIASFSSRGPVSIDGSGRLKPDIAAPGVAVYSTTVNDGYSTLQGTSMASPHVVGATALLWSAVPDLVGRIDLTEQVLIKSAIPVSVTQCGEGDSPTRTEQCLWLWSSQCLAGHRTGPASGKSDGADQPLRRKRVKQTYHCPVSQLA